MIPKGGLNNMMKQFTKMQQQMAQIQDELADLTVEGSAGGGYMVRGGTGAVRMRSACSPESPRRNAGCLHMHVRCCMLCKQWFLNSGQEQRYGQAQAESWRVVEGRGEAAQEDIPQHQHEGCS